MTSVQPWTLEVKQAQNNLSDILFGQSCGFWDPDEVSLITMIDVTVMGDEKMWDEKGSELKLCVIVTAFSLIVLKDFSAALLTPAWTAQLGSGFLFCL